MALIPEQEQKVMDALVLAVQEFNKLPVTHPSHNQDFVNGIHACQNVLIHKIVQRDYPTKFPTYKDGYKNETLQIRFR